MNAIDVLRCKVTATEVCHCEPEYVPETQSLIVHTCATCEALDRLARLVDADRRVQASKRLSWDGDDLKERNAAVREAEDALAAVLGEGAE
jgi:hypothetical protein